MRCIFDGTSNIEQSQFFDINFYCLIIKYITIVKMRGLTNDLYIVRRECWGSILPNLLITPIPFIDLVILSLIWWLKLNFSSTKIPKWFWKLTQETGILLKKTSGWNDLVIFPWKNNFLILLIQVWIKRHFRLMCPFSYFLQIFV